MLCFLVFIESHPCPPWFPTLNPTSIPHSLFHKPFVFISFADTHPLTTTESYRYKITGGEGVSIAITISSTLPAHKSFRCNTYGLPCKYCKQRVYAVAKFSRCNTYKKHGVPPLSQVPFSSLFSRRSDLQTSRLFQLAPPPIPILAVPDCGHSGSIAAFCRRRHKWRA